MKKTLGAKAPPSVKMTPRWGYVSPLDPELVEAWIQKSGDPDDVVPDWIRSGAPLGTEEEIPYRGIFPKNTDESNMDYQGAHELEDAAAQMQRGEKSSTTCRFRTIWQTPRSNWTDTEKKVSWQTSPRKREMAHGTISRLGLITKQKPEGVKRRIILDLRRSSSATGAAGIAQTQRCGGNDPG